MSVERGPEVKPGEVIPVLLNLGRDEMGERVVLAVLENAKHRIPFVLIGAPGYEELARLEWTNRLGGGPHAWLWAFSRPWEGPWTLDEAIADMQRLFGPLEVLRFPPVAPEVAPTSAANDGPAYEAGIAFWVGEFTAAINAGGITCECGAVVVIEPQADGRELIVCSVKCGK